jgi:hypothetical protein
MRHYKDWLAAFLEYSSYGEAPRHMYFWAGVSAVAGALRRKVWIDQAYFRWFPNFYVCLVAPPGIVSKSTTASIALNLLRRVPGIKFGPDVVTWPALVSAFAASTEGFEHDGAIHAMSAMTLESSEFGNLLNPKDTQMVDLLVSLWDGKQGAFAKQTKHSGQDSIENPWINLIACTTPAWLAGNFPEYMVGGGFTSRVIFVYADAKAQLVAYPGLRVPKNLSEFGDKLVDDLTAISLLVGEYRLTPGAIEWGNIWYEKHHSSRAANLDLERFGGYLARKQTHIHKLAMILAASSNDELWITEDHLQVAYDMITDLEPDMQFVFSRIGRSDMSLYVDKLIGFVHGRGKCPYSEAFRHVHMFFPSMREFEDAMAGCIRAGYIKLIRSNGEDTLVAGSTTLPSAKNGSVLRSERPEDGLSGAGEG